MTRPLSPVAFLLPPLTGLTVLIGSLGLVHAQELEVPAEPGPAESDQEPESPALDDGAWTTRGEVDDAPAPLEPEPPAGELSDAPVEAAAAGEEVAVPPPEPPPVASPWPLTVTTSTFSRFEWRDGYDRLGVSRGRFVEGDTTVYRARLGLRTNPLEVTEGVRALVQFSPQTSGQYGKTGSIAVQDVGLYEGYLRIEGEALSLDVGRFAMNYGDALVIGNLDWHQNGRSFEGARSRYKLEKGWVDAFVTQTPRATELTAEGHPTLNEPIFAGDTYFWGVYAALGGYVKEKMDLDLYLLGLSSGKTRGLPVDPEDPDAGTFRRRAATELTLGVRAKDNITSEIDYRVEAGFQTGARPNPTDAGRTTRKVSAYQVEGEVGLRFVEPLRIALGGASASGNDPATDRDEGWNDLYPTGHKFLGLMDVTGPRTNIWSAMAKLQAKLGAASVLNVDYHYFGRYHTPEGVEKQLGSEINAYLVQKFGGPLSARALYGIFLPNSGHFGTSDSAHYLEVELAVVF